MVQQPLMESGPALFYVGDRKGTMVGAGGVSDLAEQPQGARFSVRRGAHAFASFDGYHHDLGKHPSSRRHVLDRKSVLSCLVMYNAWMLFW